LRIVLDGILALVTLEAMTNFAKFLTLGFAPFGTLKFILADILVILWALIGN
jgi:hypothetical protein